MALRHTLAQHEAVGKLGAGWQSARVGDDGYVVLVADPDVKRRRIHRLSPAGSRGAHAASLMYHAVEGAASIDASPGFLASAKTTAAATRSNTARTAKS